MLTAMFTEAIVESFEDAIAVLPALVMFIPMLMDTAGNAGAQSSALIIRGMALGEIRPKDVIRVLWRELSVALICGVSLSAVNFLRVFIMGGDALLSLTISLTLILTIIIAKILGCMLPMLAKKIKIDPAVMAAPLITTIADVSALLLYFSLANIILGI